MTLPYSYLILLCLASNSAPIPYYFCSRICRYLYYDGGIAKEIFAHFYSPSILTFMTINNQYVKWCYATFKKKLDKFYVLSVLRAF